ncbi:MAG: DUF805 domain-containing protein [Curtobacterium sp.]
MHTIAVPTPSSIRRAGLVTSVKRFWLLAGTFSGRASRSEYWWSVLHLVVISLALSIPSALFVPMDVSSATPDALVVQSRPLSVLETVSTIVSLLAIVPSTAVQIRRLHDTGRSGWLVLLALIPVVGSIILLVFCLQRGQDAPNRFDGTRTRKQGGTARTVWTVLGAVIAGEAVVAAVVGLGVWSVQLAWITNASIAGLLPEAGQSSVISTALDIAPIGTLLASGELDGMTLSADLSAIGWHATALVVAAVVACWTVLMRRNERRRAAVPTSA